MVADHPKEFCRLIHRFGGNPVASFEANTFNQTSLLNPNNQKINNFENYKKVKPMIVRAMFTDLTHDNPSLYKV